MTTMLDIARSHLGVREVTGRQGNNPKILEFFRKAGHPEVEFDEVAWCSAFACACAVDAGLPTPPKSSSLMARSWLSWGVSVPRDAIRPGDVGVWPRGKAPFGHVAIVSEVHANGTVTVIGGNQSNTVSYDEMNIKSALDFRRAVPATAGALRRAGSSEIKAGDALQAGGAAASVVSVGLGAAQSVTDATVQALPTVSETLKTATESVTLGDQFVRALTSLGQAFVHAPWIVGVLSLGGACYIAGLAIKRHRIAKAAAGAPLSSQI